MVICSFSNGQRMAKGNHIVDANGKPVATSAQEYIGNFNPKATLGFTNTFQYKSFSLRILMDGRIGGTMVSGTNESCIQRNSEVTVKLSRRRLEPWRCYS